MPRLELGDPQSKAPWTRPSPCQEGNPTPESPHDQSRRVPPRPAPAPAAWRSGSRRRSALRPGRARGPERRALESTGRASGERGTAARMG
eukprot:scaffold886_cov149-Isochrysis_galbana.AAC.1